MRNDERVFSYKKFRFNFDEKLFGQNVESRKYFKRNLFATLRRRRGERDDSREKRKR